jgi:hypothetical protein
MHPGKIPPSQSPRKNRVAMRPDRLFTVPWRHVDIPNRNIRPGTGSFTQLSLRLESDGGKRDSRQTWGLKRLIRRLDGISDMIYGTKLQHRNQSASSIRSAKQLYDAQYNQSRIILVRRQPQILLQPVYSRICDIHPMQVGSVCFRKPLGARLHDLKRTGRGR